MALQPLTAQQLREVARQALSGATGEFWAALEPQWGAEVERWCYAQQGVMLPPPYLAGKFVADQVAAGRLPPEALRRCRLLTNPFRMPSSGTK